jgi:hypothetical protein
MIRKWGLSYRDQEFKRRTRTPEKAVNSDSIRTKLRKNRRFITLEVEDKAEAQKTRRQEKKEHGP